MELTYHGSEFKQVRAYCVRNDCPTHAHALQEVAKMQPFVTQRDIGYVSPVSRIVVGGNKSSWIRSYLQASKFSAFPRRERATVGSKVARRTRKLPRDPGVLIWRFGAENGASEKFVAPSNTFQSCGGV